MLELQNKQNLFSNASGSYVSKEEIDATIKLTQQLAAANAAKKAAEAETGCHKPFPMLFKKKKAYLECMANSQKIKADALKLANTPAPTAPVYVPPAPKKILGMEQSAGVAVIIFGTAAIFFGLYTVLKLKPKTA